jgi:cell division septum initiation protein DivIVA
MNEPMSDEQLAEIRADDCAMEIAEVVELLTEVDRLRTELAHMTVARDVFVQLTKEAETERDRLAEQVKRADEENRALAREHDLLAKRVWMAAAEMHEFNSPEGDHLPDCPGCRIERALGGTEAGR